MSIANDANEDIEIEEEYGKIEQSIPIVQYLIKKQLFEQSIEATLGNITDTNLAVERSILK